MNKDEALKLALEALLVWKGFYAAHWDKSDEQAITAIKEALAQPEQEPVAWLNRDSVDGLWYPNAFKTDNLEPSIPLYTTPPQRQPLTDEELYKVFPAIATYHEANKTLYRSIARLIEIAHGIKEKNT